MTDRLSIGKALAQYPSSDPQERAVLERLDEREAAQAFDRLEVVDPQKALKILRVASEADDLNRNFHNYRKELAKRRELLLRLGKYLDGLREFAQTLTENDIDPDTLFSKQNDGPVEIARLKTTIGWLEYRIEGGLRTIQEDKLRLGFTRKSDAPGASRIAALGWLAEGIHKLTGRPHYNEVAELANALFKTKEHDEITEEHVRRAAAIRKREWRRAPGRLLARTYMKPTGQKDMLIVETYIPAPIGTFDKEKLTKSDIVD